MPAVTADEAMLDGAQGDPNERIIDRFTRCLPPPSPDPALAQTPPQSVASELERLAGLRDHGVISADEFEVAKAEVLGS
jgi:Short C-terminal domain